MDDQEEQKTLAGAILARCGNNYGEAVKVAVQLGHDLWRLFAEGEGLRSGEVAGHWRPNKVIPEDKLMGIVCHLDPNLSDSILKALELSRLLVRNPANRSTWFARLDIFSPFTLVRSLLAGLRPDHDLRFYTMRSIREIYQCSLSDRTVADFRRLAKALSEVRAIPPDPADPQAVPSQESSERRSGAIEKKSARHRSGPRSSRGNKHLHLQLEVLPSLGRALPFRDPGEARRTIDLFLECCRAVRYVGASHIKDHLFRRTSAIDPEYLVSKLFSLTTGIRGFDELFGGSGLLLGQAPSGEHEVQGRTILVTGHYGTGKSLLSLQLAVEVARKGGVALFLLLEQTADECLFMLQSIGALQDDRAMEIATDIDRAADLLVKTTEGKGALLLLRFSSVRESFSKFLEELEKTALGIAGVRTKKPVLEGQNVPQPSEESIHSYPLRLVVVDPVNSVYVEKKGSEQLRRDTLEVISRIKATGTNILLVAEEESHPAKRLRFEHNIADTVIHLSVERDHGYAQRYFSILKSRLQREQRGDHPFSIKAGSGINIFPTSAAISARIRTRDVLPPERFVKFGVPSLDAILGEKAIAEGDVVVIRGPGGSYKTELGLRFVLHSSQLDPEEGDSQAKSEGKSLLIAVHDHRSTVDRQLKNMRDLLRKKRIKAKRPEDIVVCCLPRGHVQPGFIFDQIEGEFRRAQIEGYRFERVLIDDVEHWEMSCPFVRDDEIFGDTLLSYLRHKHVTSLLTCQEVPGPGNSVVQQSIVNGADCLVLADRFTYRGLSRVMIRVAKTREHAHRRDSFELVLGPTGPEFKPQSSLLRVDPDGEVKEVKVRLFLHSESDSQQLYNETLAGVLKSVLSRDVELDFQDRITLGRVLDLGSSSAVDELQILQLDEFQIQPRVLSMERASSAPPLFAFHPNERRGVSDGEHLEAGDLEDRFPRLVNRVRLEGGFVAVPYYSNPGLLAYRQDWPELTEGKLPEPTDDMVGSWEGLAELSRKWDKTCKSLADTPPAFFFDCPRVPAENYNCLFFEILLALDENLSRERPGDLAEWITPDTAVTSAFILRQLCKRSYQRHAKIDMTPSTGVSELPAGPYQARHRKVTSVSHNACVWRHWYTTLNQMLSELDPPERAKIRVRTLPGDVAVAGEWYLALPSYSAAPDVGLEIIRHLTRREAELDRVWSGVGMPTRRSFFGTSVAPERGVSPFFSLDGPKLGAMIDKAFMRSRIIGYEKISRTLAFHLVEIIRIPDVSEPDLKSRIRRVLQDLASYMQFVK